MIPIRAVFSLHNSHLSLLFFSPGLKTQWLPAKAVQGQFKLGLWQGTVLSEWGGGGPAAQLKYRLLVSLQANGNQLWGRFNFSGSKHSPREETLTLSQPELLRSSDSSIPCASTFRPSQVFHQPKIAQISTLLTIWQDKIWCTVHQKANGK